MVWEGPNAISVVRATMGATRPFEAAPGTIRADFALETGRNIVHGSANAEDAAREWTCSSSRAKSSTGLAT